jgi:cystathionine beta-lyase
MKYNFDLLPNRRHTSSLKWDVLDNELPMWVADMDFYACDKIINKLKNTADFGNFGYKNIPNTYFDSYKSWWKRRHNFEMDTDWMIFSTGVVPAISSIVRKITTVGEKVLVTTPCYNIFFNSIVNNGRNILASNLIYENKEYKIDWIDFESKIKDPQVSLMILCNPHNRVGKIWSFDELKKIGELSVKYNVIVLSDEIHCDIVSPGYEYIPYISVSEECKMNSVTAISATKCFGIPGLQSSAVVIPNKFLRHKVNRGLNTDECAEGNVFAYDPIIAAFNQGEEWVNEMNEYVYQNKKLFTEELKDTKLKIVKADALYLVWVDVSEYTHDAKEFVDHLKESTGLYVTEGEEYGPNGKSFFRINLATSRDNVYEATRRIKSALKTL